MSLETFIVNVPCCKPQNFSGCRSISVRILLVNLMHARSDVLFTSTHIHHNATINIQEQTYDIKSHVFKNDYLWPCVCVVWFAGVVSAGRLSHTGTMRRTGVSSVRRTTGLNSGSCVMAVQSPSPPDSSWWVKTVRNRISAVSPHPTILPVLRFLTAAPVTRFCSAPFTQLLLPDLTQANQQHSCVLSWKSCYL